MNEPTRQVIRKAAEAEAAAWPELTDVQIEELRFLLSRPSAEQQQGAA